jgi:sugar (pentulose or hexulose) kinase
MVTEKPYFDPKMHTWTNCHLDPSLWCLESNAIVTGLSIRWLRDTFFPGMGYEQLNALSARTPIGSKGTMAFLGAELMDMPQYNAAWTGGFLFQVPPSEIGLGEMVRSSWESIAYAVRGNVEQIFRITGEETKELNVCGGQTSSQVGMGILTDVIGIPINIHRSQSSILGAAVCAAFGIGLYPSFIEASQQMTSEVMRLIPDLKNHEIYSSEYHHWLSHYKILKEL